MSIGGMYDGSSGSLGPPSPVPPSWQLHSPSPRPASFGFAPVFDEHAASTKRSACLMRSILPRRAGDTAACRRGLPAEVVDDGSGVFVAVERIVHDDANRDWLLRLHGDAAREPAASAAVHVIIAVRSHHRRAVIAGPAERAEHVHVAVDADARLERRQFFRREIGRTRIDGTELEETAVY